MAIIAVARRLARVPTRFTSAFVARPPPLGVAYIDTNAPLSAYAIVPAHRKRSRDDYLEVGVDVLLPDIVKVHRIDDKPALASLRGKRSIEEVYFIDGLDTPESTNKHPKLPVEDDVDTVDGAPAALWYEWLYTATQGDEDTDFVPKLTAANLNSHTGSNGASPAPNNQDIVDDVSDADSSSSFDGDSIISCERYEAEALADPYDDNLDDEDAMSVDSDDEDDVGSRPTRAVAAVLPGPRQLRSATASAPAYYSAAAAAAPAFYAAPSIYAQNAQILKDGNHTFAKSAAAFNIGAGGFSRSAAAATAPGPAPTLNLKDDDEVMTSDDDNDDDDDLVATASERPTAALVPGPIQHRASPTTIPAFYPTAADATVTPAFDNAAWKLRQQQARLAASGLVTFSSSSRAFGIAAGAPRPSPAVALARPHIFGAIAATVGAAPAPLNAAAHGPLLAAPHGFANFLPTSAAFGLRN